MVSLELPEAEGGCLVPHHSVLELLKYVPGNEMLTIERKRKRLNLAWDGGNASYDVAEPEDYPPIPEVEPKATGNLDGDKLVATLDSVVDYCATDEKRPVLTGVILSLGETIEIVAADGFRMAYQTLSLSFPAEDTVVIPAPTVRILSYLWEKVPPAVPLESSLVRQVTAKRQLELALGDARLMLHFGRVTLVSQLIAGTPPNYRQLIPEDTPLKVRVFAPELERAVRRLREIARDSSGIVRLSWTEAELTVSAKSEDKAEVRAEVPVQTEGGSGRVALNLSYLLDYLKGKEGLLTIGARGFPDPVLFRHSTSPLVMIMPMNVQW